MSMDPPPDAPVVVGIGELLWDCFGDVRRPGGAPANVAYHACQLGLRGVVCSRVGCDTDGDELLEHLRRHGLPTDYVQRDPRHPTGRVTVDTTRADHPQFTIHTDAAWDYLECDERWRDLLHQAAAVCFGTLAQRSAHSRRAIYEALEAARQAIRVYDVNLRPPFFEREHIEASLRRATIVKLNIEEVRTLANMFAVERDTARFSGWLRQAFGVQLVSVTRGADGCVLVHGNDVVDIPGRPVQVVDTVGAGDAFTAALIAAHLWGWAPERCGAFASEVGARVVTRRGAMPDVHGEYISLIACFEQDASSDSDCH